MAIIKDIAALANVSQGTASLVLNGKGDQYRISPATQQKIFEAARQLNYRPNISARRLRSGGETVLPVVALLWTLDARASLIGRFLRGLQQSMAELQEDCELLVLPYVGDRLCDIASLRTGTRFNGAIIANLTEEDEQFLEEADLNVPVVLYQRHSKKYACVNVDSFRSGKDVAAAFAERGYRNVGLIVPDVSSSAVRLRVEGFLDGVSERGLQLCPPVRSDFSESGGSEAIHRLCRECGDQFPQALFVASDQMAVGALAALRELGKDVPRDVAIVGYDDDEVARYTVPSLSTVHLPVERMASACLEIILNLMEHRTNTEEPPVKTLETHLVFRRSFGEPERPQ